MTEQPTSQPAAKAAPARPKQDPKAAEKPAEAKSESSAAVAPAHDPAAADVQSPAEAGETETVEVPAGAPYIAGLTGDGLERDSLGQLPPPDMEAPAEGGAHYDSEDE